MKVNHNGGQRNASSAGFRRMAILLAAAIPVACAMVLYLNNAYVWVCLLFVVVCLFVFISSRNTAVRTVAVNAGAVLFVLGCFEIYLSNSPIVNDLTRGESRNGEGQLITRDEPDDVLGWAPVAGQVINFSRYYKDKQLFDVVYKVDDTGLRVSNAQPLESGGACVLVFGGSFTFGEGVNDDESLPYILGSITEQDFRVYNFGYSGYGAHQMLAALELGIVDNVIDCEPEFVIYQGIVDHLLRAANKVTWTNDSGPRFVLDQAGLPVYSGQFDEPTFRNLVRRAIRKSHTVRALTASRVTRDDIELFVAIINGSRQWLQRRYPGSKFHVLFWDEPDNRYSRQIIAGLREKDGNIHLVSKILPDFIEDRLKYIISPYDHHPNPLANSEIAEYVNNEIIGPGAVSR